MKIDSSAQSLPCGTPKSVAGEAEPSGRRVSVDRLCRFLASRASVLESEARKCQEKADSLDAGADRAMYQRFAITEANVASELSLLIEIIAHGRRDKLWEASRTAPKASPLAPAELGPGRNQ